MLYFCNILESNVWFEIMFHPLIVIVCNAWLFGKFVFKFYLNSLFFLYKQLMTVFMSYSTVLSMQQYTIHCIPVYVLFNWARILSQLSWKIILPFLLLMIIVLFVVAICSSQNHFYLTVKQWETDKDPSSLFLRHLGLCQLKCFS